MSKSFIYCLFALLISCTGNHHHDGKYAIKALGETYGYLEIKGDELYCKVSSDGLTTGNYEVKTSCKQYSDRIEFDNGNGTTTIGRFDKNGNLDMVGYTFYKVSENEKIPEDSKSSVNKSKPEKKKVIKSTSESKSNSDQEKLVSPIKTYSEADFSYNYTQSVRPDVNEKFFQGTKNFEGHIDDLFTVTITGDKIKIIAPQDGDEVVLSGSIKKGEILNPEGLSSKFIYIKPNLYYKDNSKVWFVFYELN